MRGTLLAVCAGCMGRVASEQGYPSADATSREHNDRGAETKVKKSAISGDQEWE